MNHDRDPLLRAVRDGDTACPDGAALAELGRRIREASELERSVDLVPRVLARLDANVVEGDDDLDDAAIDAFYNEDGGAIRDDLLRLSELIRTGSTPPHPIDLEAAVRARIKGGSLRLTAQRASDLSARFRIWSAVVAGHVAALLTIATWHYHQDEPATISGSDAVAVSAQTGGNQGHVGTQGQHVVAPPTAWEDLAANHHDLFASRASEQARSQALADLNLTETAPLVIGGLHWLCLQQDADGHFGVATTDSERDLATQSLAVLALLGEGVDDPELSVAARRSLSWIEAHQRSDDFSGNAPSLAALALVEGAALYDDDALRASAAEALRLLPVDQTPGPSALGGFTWLALQTAATTGTPVSGRALAKAEAMLREATPTQNDTADASRIGLAAYVRLVSGRHALSSTSQLLTMLDEGHLRPRVDAAGRIDPLGWLFATWAMRQAGGDTWQAWADELATTTLPVFQRNADQRTAWVDANAVRFADTLPENGAIYATAVSVIALQAPYRSVR
jgi:hypothetical protein